MRVKYLWMVVLALLVSSVHADVVELNNGDKITGKIGEVAGGKMKFTSPVLGDITIDLANVKSYSTDEPVRIIQKTGMPIVTDKVVSGDANEVAVAGGTTLPTSDIRTLNPPPEKWTGFFIANLSIARGNTETIDAGIEAKAELRRRNEKNDDRFTIYGAYNFANTGTGGSSVTTEENVQAFVKYDRFFTPKWYGYGLVGFMKDHLADLDYRFLPGVGLGYQWYETPTFNLSTEAGLSYIFEYYDPGGSNDFLALRLAYHVDKKLRDNISVFHNLAYLPSVEDPFADYLINADLGLQLDITKTFFTQAKVEWEYDSEPAPGRDNNDYRFLVGVGWRF